MKSATVTGRPTPPTRLLPFPNAATPRQILHKVLNVLLMAACGAGLAALFLLILVVF